MQGNHLKRPAALSRSFRVVKDRQISDLLNPAQSIAARELIQSQRERSHGIGRLEFRVCNEWSGNRRKQTVTQILANYQQVETPWKNQLTALQSQDTVLSTLGTQVSTLATDMQKLTDAQGDFAAKSGSSSDTNVLELTSASSTAAAGTHSVTVENLAQTSSAASAAVGASDTLSGSVTIQVGSGQQDTVNVGDSSTASTISGLGGGHQCRRDRGYSERSYGYKRCKALSCKQYQWGSRHAHSLRSACRHSGSEWLAKRLVHTSAGGRGRKHGSGWHLPYKYSQQYGD